MCPDHFSCLPYVRTADTSLKVRYCATFTSWCRRGTGKGPIHHYFRESDCVHLTQSILEPLSPCRLGVRLQLRRGTPASVDGVADMSNSFRQSQDLPENGPFALALYTGRSTISSSHVILRSYKSRWQDRLSRHLEAFEPAIGPCGATRFRPCVSHSSSIYQQRKISTDRYRPDLRQKAN